MTGAAIHCCQECGGAVNVEHYLREEFVGHSITYLYCDYCSVGWEALWKQKPDGSEVLQFEVRYSGQSDATKDATKLGMFLQRLKNARQQAA